MAHVTGGGMTENMHRRVLRATSLRKSNWDRGMYQRHFAHLQKLGNVPHGRNVAAPQYYVGLGMLQVITARPKVQKGARYCWIADRAKKTDTV